MFYTDNRKSEVFSVCPDLTAAPAMPMGFATGEHFDLLVFSPAWRAGDVFQGDSHTVVRSRGTGYQEILTPTQKIGWVCTGLTGGVLDSVLTAEELDCPRMLFLDQAAPLSGAALTPGLVVPNKTIYGGDALEWLERSPFSGQEGLEVRRTPPRGVLWVNKAAYQQGIRTSTRTVLSCETRLAAAGLENQAQALGAETADCYSALFSRCMMKLGRNGTSLLVVPGEKGAEAILRQQVCPLLLRLSEERQRAA